MSNVIVVVQARMGSSRLPGKSMMPLGGRPLVQHALERACTVRGISAVCLATSNNARDLPLAELAQSLGIPAVRGDEHDVLGRYAAAADLLNASVVIRITGDCPFTAPDVVSLVLDKYRASTDLDYVSNDTTKSGYPDGLDVEVFSRWSLDQAALHAVTKTDREHVTPWIRRHLRTHTVNSKKNWGFLKLSVDCPRDLEEARLIYGYIRHGDYSFQATMAAVVAAHGADICGLRPQELR